MGATGLVEKPIIIHDERKNIKATESHTMPKPDNGVLEKVIREAIIKGVEPLKAIALGHYETNLGTYTKGQQSEKDVFLDPLQSNPFSGEKPDQKRISAIKMSMVKRLNDYASKRNLSVNSDDEDKDVANRQLNSGIFQGAQIEDALQVYKDKGFEHYRGKGSKAKFYSKDIKDLYHGYYSDRNKPFVEYVNSYAEKVRRELTNAQAN